MGAVSRSFSGGPSTKLRRRVFSQNFLSVCARRARFRSARDRKPEPGGMRPSANLPRHTLAVFVCQLLSSVVVFTTAPWTELPLAHFLDHPISCGDLDSPRSADSAAVSSPRSRSEPQTTFFLRGSSTTLHPRTYQRGAFVLIAKRTLRRERSASGTCSLQLLRTTPTRSCPLQSGPRRASSRRSL